MSEKSYVGFDWTFPGVTEAFRFPYIATHLATKDDSSGGLVSLGSNSAERLLSEQSVLLLGEANSQ